MNFKARAGIKEYFIHLKGARKFINLQQIEQLEYDLDNDDNIIGVTIYMNSSEDLILLSDTRDIKTIAHYFGLAIQE